MRMRRILTNGAAGIHDMSETCAVCGLSVRYRQVSMVGTAYGLVGALNALGFCLIVRGGKPATVQVQLPVYTHCPDLGRVRHMF